MMKFKDVNIVLQEIPNEVSLSLTITGCNLRCDGCHSPYLWKATYGELLTDEVLIKFLDKYKNVVSCVLFMGGEWYEEELLKKIDIVKSYGLKVALYTGLENDEVAEKHPRLLEVLDYIKTGRWISKLGGLNSEETNQQLIDIKNNKVINHYFIK